MKSLTKRNEEVKRKASRRPNELCYAIQTPVTFGINIINRQSSAEKPSTGARLSIALRLLSVTSRDSEAVLVARRIGGVRALIVLHVAARIGQ